MGRKRRGANGAHDRERRQGIFWCLTIPHARFTPYLPGVCRWIRGQLERGDSGYLHWQLITAFTSKQSLAFVRETFGDGAHATLSRSAAASDYVWKELTRVEGTQFELGTKPVDLASKTDWDIVWTAAISWDLQSIPAGIRVRSYHALRSIRADHSRPTPMSRTCSVYWGVTGSGKSHRAWNEATYSAYAKDPRSKFWCGYAGEEHVVIDEFRGGIDVSHLLRWLDQYPVTVEIKGSSVPLYASRIWITSNVDPRDWYPDLDDLTRQALLRRLDITHFAVPYSLP